VTELLGPARIDGGKKNLQFRRIDIEALLKHIVRFFAALVDRNAVAAR